MQQKQGLRRKFIVRKLEKGKQTVSPKQAKEKK